MYILLFDSLILVRLNILRPFVRMTYVICKLCNAPTFVICKLCNAATFFFFGGGGGALFLTAVVVVLTRIHVVGCLCMPM